MKNYFSPLAALALLLAVTACKHEVISNGGEEEQVKPVVLAVTGEATDITLNSATLTGYAYIPSGFGEVEIGIIYDSEQTFANASKVVATGLDSESKFTVTLTDLEQGTTYYYKSYVLDGMTKVEGEVKYFTTEVDPVPAGAVDLGIVMTRGDGTSYNLYWAKSNLCESGLCANPEDYGDYYACGETEPYYTTGHSKDESCNSWRSRTNPEIMGYDWPSYKWCNGTYTTLTKYCTDSTYGEVDNITEIQRGENPGETLDDAARYVLGGKWRMPTDAEWTALFSQCNWGETTQNGEKGLLITANNGNSIFLPAAGFWERRGLKDADGNGYYLSSTLNTEFPPCVRGVEFHTGRSPDKYNCYRCSGHTIRPVSE